MKIRFGLIIVLIFYCTFSFGQATITIEVNWPSWSSENRVTFRDASDIQIGNTICNPSACFTGAGNNSYNNIGSPETYNSVPYGTGYDLFMEDAFGDGWNGGTSYVRVYQDGVLIVDTDLSGGFSGTFTFNITAPSPVMVVNDVSVNETDGTANFTVTHTNAAASGSFTVDFQTTDGSATASTDYTATSGTLNFDGSVNDTETITVPILNDSDIEAATETFTIDLVSSSDGTVDISDTATGSITDDDGIVITDGGNVSRCDGTFLDSGGLGINYSNNEDRTFTICPDSGDYVMVDFTNFDVPVGDILYIYRGNSTGAGNLIGQYDNSNIPSAIGSTAGNGCLTFRFTSDGSTTGEGWEALVSCHVDGPMLVIDDISFDEDVGVAIFTVTQTREAHGFNFFGFFVHRPFTVDFQTVDGTATAGTDYTGTTGTVTFNGQIGNTQSISIPITSDGVPEDDEFFTIEFTGADADFATINYADTATGTINSQISGNVPLTLFRSFDGKFDYTTTGGTLRTNDNATDACSITTTSSNTLVSTIPAGATIEAAYLYWAHSETTRDQNVTFEGQAVSADFLYQTTLTNRNFYGYVSEVTSIVRSVADPSTNTWNFSDLTIDNTGDYCSTATVLGAWALMIFYEEASLPAVNINLYQGFDGLSNAGTSFTLDSFFAISGSGAKATFMSYEGDPNLDGSSIGSTNPEELSITNQAGTTNILTGDGGQTGNNSYNSTIYDNTAAPVYNTTTSYGLDLDTYDISTYISPADNQVTANVDVGQDFVISSAVVIKVPSNLIRGTVFEDMNYPGGAGRNMLVSSGAPVVAAAVELYNSTGSFLERVYTDANGAYAFGGMPDGDYSIRVANATVRSTRGNGLNCSTCYPVQTFRSFGNSTTVTEVTDEIGGADPDAFQDTSLGVLAGAQSISSVTVASDGVTNIDFGFNFNTIVNTNDTGQGSIEQFIVNANNLDETGLDILANSIFDPAAGDDTSIFMIPPISDPLGRTADTNFSSGYFDIDIPALSNLSPITGDNTIIDGRTQTSYSGDTNSGTIGSGGTTVGVSSTSLPSYNRPEIQIHGEDGDIFVVQANNVEIRNLSIYANSNSAIRIDSGGLEASDNLIGVNAVGANSGNLNIGVEMLGGTLLLQRNYLSQAQSTGLSIGGGTSTVVEYNEFHQNGLGSSCGDNISLGGTGVQIRYNLVHEANALGIEGFGYSGDPTIEENTIANNGVSVSSCSGTFEDAGIRLEGSNASIIGNIINNNQGEGIVIAKNGTGNLISRNSIYNNGLRTGAALGIDLDNTNGANDVGDGVTLNDTNDLDSGPNGRINFPIISAAYFSGSNLVIKGWSRPGATIELFFTDINEGSASIGDNRLGLTQDYGEGQIYIASLVEGSGSDTDSQSSSYADADGNTDTTNRFQFSVPLPLGANLGDSLTATATLSNSTSEFSPSKAIAVSTVITNRRITYRVNRN